MKKTCYRFISVGIVVFFILTSIQVFALKNSPITAYGEEAKSFVSRITEKNDVKTTLEQQGNVLIAVSDLKNVNAERIVNSLRNGDTLVVINLPINNKLLPVPTLSEKKSQLTYELDINSQTKKLIQSKGSSEKEIYPEYWISVIKYNALISTKNFLLITKDTLQKREQIITAATEEVLATPPPIMLESSGSWQKKMEVDDLIVFGDEDSQFYIRHEVYQLDVYDDVVNKEYWRVDSFMDHLMNDYEEITMHCGPYIKYREIKVDASSAAQLYRYDPKTTVSDTTVSVNIGFSVSYKSAGFNINYGWSWTNPGVEYAVAADYSQKRVTTLETFREPDYTLWPFYTGPCSAAYNSYSMEPSTVMRTNVGTGFDLENLESTWTLYDDHYYWIGAHLFFNRNVYSYTRDWNPSPISSMF